MNNFVYGNDRYQNYETICGGTGAGPDHDGTSAVHSHMTNTRMTDPEVLEWRFPVRLETFRIRHGSGGAGPAPGRRRRGAAHAFPGAHDRHHPFAPPQHRPLRPGGR